VHLHGGLAIGMLFESAKGRTRIQRSVLFNGALPNQIMPQSVVIIEILGIKISVEIWEGGYEARACEPYDGFSGEQTALKEWRVVRHLETGRITNKAYLR
jgi:hypothetical protein